MEPRFLNVVDLSKFPMVEALVEDLRAYALTVEGFSTTDSLVTKIKNEFDVQGPFQFAKSRNLLVNGSGEEFAIQFMSFYNQYSGNQVY